MTFENFRKEVEFKLNSITEFELQEYHYEPYSFGNGVLAYRINGHIHKFVFDGREKELTWFVSKPHQKYFGADLTVFMKNDGLELSIDALQNGIKTAHNKA